LLLRALGYSPSDVAHELQRNADDYGLNAREAGRWADFERGRGASRRYFEPKLGEDSRKLFEEALREAETRRKTTAISSKETRLEEMDRTLRAARRVALGATDPKAALEAHRTVLRVLEAARKETEGDVHTVHHSGTIGVQVVGVIGLAAGVDYRNTPLSEFRDRIFDRVKELCEFLPESDRAGLAGLLSGGDRD
tara:strand:+ start:131 stop:715 length:585 start_codon:yes stop_codon:yes gene_type:complete